MTKNNPVHRVLSGVAVAVQVGLCDGRVFNGLLRRKIEGLRDVGAEKGLDVVDTGEVVYGPDLKIQWMRIPASERLCLVLTGELRDCAAGEASAMKVSWAPTEWPQRTTGAPRSNA